MRNEKKNEKLDTSVFSVMPANSDPSPNFKTNNTSDVTSIPENTLALGSKAGASGNKQEMWNTSIDPIPSFSIIVDIPISGKHT